MASLALVHAEKLLEASPKLQEASESFPEASGSFRKLLGATGSFWRLLGSFLDTQAGMPNAAASAKVQAHRTGASPGGCGIPPRGLKRATKTPGLTSRTGSCRLSEPTSTRCDAIACGSAALTLPCRANWRIYRATSSPRASRTPSGVPGCIAQW